MAIGGGLNIAGPNFEVGHNAPQRRHHRTLFTSALQKPSQGDPRTAPSEHVSLLRKFCRWVNPDATGPSVARSGQKPSGIRPDPKAAVSAMPVVSVKAKARIAAIFMANHPSSAMTMLQEQEKSCALRHTRDCGRNGIIPGPTSGQAAMGPHFLPAVSFTKMAASATKGTGQ